MAEKLIIKEPVFIEADGQRIAVILPIEDYESLRAQSQLPQTATDTASSGFEREKAAFQALKPELLKRYPGQFVAIVNGQVVEVGDDKIQVIDRVHERLGQVSMYVQQITDQPHVYYFPHRRVIRS
ncbi:MAG TPA: DUF5678 domain-containing protein [Anaerolineae bacterium]